MHVPGARAQRGANVRIATIHSNAAFVDVTFVGVVQMPVVKIIDVVAVPERGMAAVWAVDVLMRFVGMVAHACWLP